MSMRFNILKWNALVAVLWLATGSWAAGPTAREPGGGAALPRLDAIPPSGKAREGGFDGRYGMEPTTAEAELDTLCAQGSRGLIMVSNATWRKCGGKPKGASMGPEYYPAMPPWNKAGTGAAAQIMDHSKMKH